MTKLTSAPITAVSLNGQLITFDTPLREDELREMEGFFPLAPSTRVAALLDDQGLVRYWYDAVSSDEDRDDLCGLMFSGTMLCEVAEPLQDEARAAGDLLGEIICLDLNVAPWVSDARRDHTVYAGHVIRLLPR